MPAPIANFAGVGANGASPPDTEGDIGPNYYMQWVNLQFRIYHRDGTPATPATPGYQLFTGQNVCGTPSGNGGDPIVVYDQFAHRWIASQLAYPNYPGAGPYYQCVAYSSTDDPTGTWCAYQFVALQSKLNDYPKFGVWPAQHAYMITVNQFAEPGDGWAGVGVFALERDAMMSGCGSARMLYKDMFTVEPNLWGGMLPADADGTTPPPDNAPAPLIEVDAQRVGSGALPAGSARRLERDRRLGWCRHDQCLARRSAPDRAVRRQPLQLRVLRPAARHVAEARHAQRPADVPDGVPELRRPSGTRGQPLGGHQRRRPSRACAGTSCGRRRGNWSIYQQGTYEPDTTVNRWMGSAAMDHDGNMAIGFSTSSGTAPNYPSVRYAGRLATDPLGELSQGESTLIAGTGSQTGIDRWGDYSMLTSDPADDCTFWFTSEYMVTTGSAWQTRIGSFKFPSCGGPPPPPPPPPPHPHPHHPALRLRRHLRRRRRLRRHPHRLRLRRRLRRPPTTSAATSASGPLPSPESPRPAPRSREDEDPPSQLLGRPGAPR